MSFKLSIYLTFSDLKLTNENTTHIGRKYTREGSIKPPKKIRTIKATTNSDLLERLILNRVSIHNKYNTNAIIPNSVRISNQ
jgi:hypothetical protein